MMRVMPVTADGSATNTRTRRPTPEALASWRAFINAHSRITRRLEADLLAEHQLTLGVYDVLVQLVESPARRLRMTELADRVLLSRSGVTRLVDRMEREHLVVREACPSDARGMFAVLTETGYERLRRAARTHLRGIEEYYGSRLSAHDLADLRRILPKLMAVDKPLGDQVPAQQPRHPR